MPGLVPGIHVHALWQEGVDGGTSASEATPFFERLCPAMTIVDHIERIML
jgi:hypothetical protein